MSIQESLLVAALCMTIVMLVLAVLFALIKIFSFGIASMAKHQNKKAMAGSQPAAADAYACPACDSSSGDVRLHHVDERTAAMIMAIVSDESGIPLSELCFKSIRAIENKR